MEDFLTAENTAVLLSRTPQSVRLLCKKGELVGAKKFGNVWLIPRSAVEQYTPKLKGFAEVWRRRREKDKEIITTIKEAATANKL